jgi:hypothetical protein
MDTTANIQYAAVVDHVREVTLFGTADWGFWQERLRTEGLRPYSRDGRAELMIIATDLKWMGIRFNELSISVATGAGDAVSVRDGAFLVRAFNSSRLLAFAERTFFQTPYYPASVQVEDRVPCFFKLSEAGEGVLSAGMSGTAPRARSGDELWQGAVHLPTKPGSRRSLFFVKLSGQTEIYPFDSSSDALELKPPPGDNVLRWLAESNFAALEWHIRRDAVHAKSKTYKREQG